MNGYLLPLRCPRCGAELEHVNGTDRGSEAVAVARCVPCRREFTVAVQLREMPSESRFVA